MQIISPQAKLKQTIKEIFALITELDKKRSILYYTFITQQQI